MKLLRRSMLSIALAGSLMTAGCVRHTTQPLAAGAVDRVDADANTALQTAYGFAAKITAAVQSTDPQVHIDLSAQQLAALDKLNLALNVGMEAEKSYHATPTGGAVAGLQAAIQAVTDAFRAAQSQISSSIK